MNIYVDGCSYTYGYGLDRKFSLANLLSTNSDYTVTDKSEGSKSNYAMILDLYSTKTEYDLYIINWTFNYRLELKMGNSIVNMTASRTPDIVTFDDTFFEKEYDILRDKFFRYASRYHKLNDFFVDAAANLLKMNNKKFIFSTWEPKCCKEKLLYLPNKFSKNFRQNDCTNWEQVGHLNSAGMELFAEIIRDKINEQK